MTILKGRNFKDKNPVHSYVIQLIVFLLAQGMGNRLLDLEIVLFCEMFQTWCYAYVVTFIPYVVTFIPNQMVLKLVYIEHV